MTEYPYWNFKRAFRFFAVCVLFLIIVNTLLFVGITTYINTVQQELQNKQFEVQMQETNTIMNNITKRLNDRKGQ